MNSEQLLARTLTRQAISSPLARPKSVFDRLVGIQAQYIASVPQAVFARCPNVDPNWFERAMDRDRSIAKAWNLRSTVHVTTSQDHALLTHSVYPAHFKHHATFMERRRGCGPKRLAKMDAGIVRALRNGPLTTSELKEKVKELEEAGGGAWGLGIKGPAMRGDVVFAGLGDGNVRMALTKNWFRIHPQPPADPLAELILRYLQGYGPATIGDFAYWTGLTVRACREGFERVEGRIRRVEVKGAKDVYYDSTKTVKEKAIPNVVILPKFDALVLGYRDKTRVLDEDHRTRVFRPAAQVEAIILIEGRVSATWRRKARTHDVQFTVEPFGRFSKATRNCIEDVFGALATFLQHDTYSISYA